YRSVSLSNAEYGINQANNYGSLSMLNEDTSKIASTREGFSVAPSNIDGRTSIYRPKQTSMYHSRAIGAEHENSQIELPQPVQQNISSPTNNASITSSREDVQKINQHQPNLKLEVNNIVKNKSEKSVVNDQNSNTNTVKTNSSKFRMPKVHFIPRLLKFSSKSDVDHLTKENNDFKMPVFGAARKNAELRHRENEPEFSVNLRTGETTARNGNEVKGSKVFNANNKLPKINSNLNMPRTNFAIKKTKNKNHQKFQKLNSKNAIVASSRKSTARSNSKNNKLKTSHIHSMSMSSMPNLGSRGTASLLSVSQNKPRQKRPVRIENVSSTKLSPLNIDALSKVVGKYNNSNVGKYIKKTNLAIPYRSQETLDKIVAYKNSLLRRMTFRNTKQIEYIGKGQDNLLIDRLHRTTRMLSANKQSAQH
ncbi:hypothetical protein KA043_02845, partial [Candidatus Saccharibacteria bacterium]|nr:hypothetical protein [Candidatus Saccharibacteria bacterium]